MAKVFLVNNGGHDYSKATKFGELITLSEGLVTKFHVTKMMRMFRPLIGSNSGDFILLSGPTVMSCIACALFAALHGRLNLLLYRPDEAGEDHYLVRRIVFPRRKEA